MSLTAEMIRPEIRKAHRASWFVYVGEGESRRRIPREATMRGLWGYDVVCSCGWDSRTGGGTRRAVDDALLDHRMDAQYDADEAAKR